MTESPYTLRLAGTAYMLGYIAEPTLSELLDRKGQGPHWFYSNTVRIVHHSLRSPANAGIGDDEESIERLAAVICTMTVGECMDVVRKIVEFSERTNAQLAGMTLQ